MVLSIGFILAIISLIYEYFCKYKIKKNERKIEVNISIKKELLEMITELKCHQDAIEQLYPQIKRKKEFLDQLNNEN